MGPDGEENTPAFETSAPEWTQWKERTTMRVRVLVLTFACLCAAGFAPAQLTLTNTATGGPPTATTVGTLHSIDSKTFKIGAASCLQAGGTATSYLPTQAALDPTSRGNGGTKANAGFTIQWWLKPIAPTAFGYLWGDNPWSGSGGTFRCFQNGAAGTGNLFIRGPLTQLATTGAPLQNSTGPNGWVHFACVVDTTTNKVTWYVNGKQNATGAANITGKGGNFKCMGYDGSTSGTNSNFDDIRIYDWARTATDIAADYNLNARGTGPSGSPNVPDLGYYECELPTSLIASGSPKPGGTVDLTLASSISANLVYQLGSSLGTGPIPIGTRSLGLSPDGLLVVTVSGALPGIFSGYAGTMDAQGNAKAKINIPSIPALVGVRIHTAFLTLSGSAPNGVQAISNTASFSITN